MESIRTEGQMKYYDEDGGIYSDDDPYDYYDTAENAEYLPLHYWPETWDRN